MSYLEPGCPNSDLGLRESMAISLKRIADALTDPDKRPEIKLTFDVHDQHGGLTNLAWEMGKSFQAGRQAGMRTDR